jgi:large repetitive protein
MRRVFLFLLVCGLLPAQTVVAVGTNIEVSRGASDAVHGKRAIASDGTNFFLVWRDTRNGPGDVFDIYGARIARDGTVLDPGGFPIAVSQKYDPNPSNQYTPSVAFDGTNFLVVWTANKKLDTVAYEVYCARVTPAGKVLDSPELQVTAGANAERMTPIVFDGTNFFIAWRNTGNNIYGTRLSKAGLSLDGPTGFPICTAASYYPNMAFDGTNFLVVWHGTPPGGDMFHYDVYGARVTKGGAVLDPNGFPIAVDATNKEHTGIDFDGTNYLVVWYDWRPNDSSQDGSIYGARVTPGGKVLDAQSFQIAPHARRVTPFVVFDGTQFVVAYHEDHAPHHRAVDAYARTVSTAGVPGEFIPLSTSKMTQFEPNLAYSNGLFLAAFSDYEPDARIRVELLRKTGGAALPVPSKPAGTPAGTPGIWTTEFNQDPNFFSYTLWGTATNNIYAVGIGWPGNLYHNDGSGWAPVPLLDTPSPFRCGDRPPATFGPGDGAEPLITSMARRGRIPAVRDPGMISSV